MRTFPLLALAGGLLYRLDPDRLLPLSIGLAALGAWLAVAYRRRIGEAPAEVSLVVPVCNLLAYLLGPVVLAGPGWIAVGATVAAVLLLTARERLHGYARRLDIREILTAAKFLALTGLMIPVLPDQPVIPLTQLTPRQVWLGVVAVCSLSYASYLLRRTVAAQGVGLVTALLGGLYSSTATTIVLARRAAADQAGPDAESGIILATAVMHLRILAIVAVFAPALAAVLAPPMVGLALLGGGLTAWAYWRRVRPAGPAASGAPAGNPLELTAALVFAGLFVIVSLASTWARSRFGTAGVFGLAAVVGAADIDPFVLSVAEGSAGPLPAGDAAAAVLIAAASNNLVKAGYAIGFAGHSRAAVPAAALAALASAGVAAALWVALG